MSSKIDPRITDSHASRHFIQRNSIYKPIHVQIQSRFAWECSYDYKSNMLWIILQKHGQDMSNFYVLLIIYFFICTTDSYDVMYCSFINFSRVLLIPFGCFGSILLLKCNCSEGLNGIQTFTNCFWCELMDDCQKCYVHLVSFIYI